MGVHYGDLFEEWELTIVRGMVAEFEENNPWLTYPGHEALLQECFDHWYWTRSQYNPEKGASIKTYMHRVVWRKLNGIRRKEWAEKRRANHLAESLDEPMSDSGLSLKDIIPDVRGLKADKLRSELARVISKLSPFRQKVCLLARDGYSLREIEKKLGISKTRIHEELQEIRRIFRNEGLDEYLQ